MSAQKWTVDCMPDLTGKTVMVTGGTSGIGKEAARESARRGAHVVLPSITRAEGESAAAEIGGSTEVRELDLSRLDAVREFAAGYTDPIDVLLDNAGLMSRTRRETADGVELHLGVNVLGPFLLTELQNRLTAAGSAVDVQLAHPGFAATSILDPTPFPPVNAILTLLGRRIVPTAADGARPLLYAATEVLPPASYIGPSGFRQIAGVPGPCERSAPAGDPDLARRFREFAVRETGAVPAV